MQEGTKLTWILHQYLLIRGRVEDVSLVSLLGNQDL
jgi:hypothetical protein